MPIQDETNKNILPNRYFYILEIVMPEINQNIPNVYMPCQVHQKWKFIAVLGTTSKAEVALGKSYSETINSRNRHLFTYFTLTCFTW